MVLLSSQWLYTHSLLCIFYCVTESITVEHNELLSGTDQNFDVTPISFCYKQRIFSWFSLISHIPDILLVSASQTFSQWLSFLERQ